MSGSDHDSGVTVPHVAPVSTLDIHHHTELPDTSVSRVLDGFVGGAGKLFSWLWLAVIAVILVSVIARYAFGQGSIMLEEISWHLYGMAWTMGLGYTLVADGHVRVDLFHERFRLRTQAWVEMLGIVLLLVPFLVLSIHYAIPYAYNAFTQGETSQAPSGLAFRFVLKSFIAISLGFLLVAALSRVTKCSALLFGFPKPLRPAEDDQDTVK